MAFSIITELRIHDRNLILVHFHHPKRNPVPISHSPFTPPPDLSQPSQPLFYFLSLIFTHSGHYV